MTTAVELERPPLYLHVPPHVGTYGPEIADLAAAVGMELDPEQRLVTDAAGAYDEDGRLVATELGGAGPRQNFKTHCGKALALSDLVLFGMPDCLWSAHLRSTSDDAFRNATGTGLADLFDNYDFLRRLVDRNGITDSDGEKSITLRPPRAGAPRPTLKFVTRGVGGGRGLTGLRVTYDEALFLKPSMVAAMLPILSAQSMGGQVQVRYLGSPGILLSQVWREVRDRGRTGQAPGLAWIEWAAKHRPCADEQCRHQVGAAGCALDDPALIRQANLAVDRRIHIRFVLETERQGMTPQDFMVERLGWWQDPPNTTGGDLDVTRWAAQTDFTVTRGKQPVFGVDVDADGIAWIGIAWRRADGGVQVMLDNPDDRNAQRVSAITAPARVRELVKSYGGTVALGGPASRIEPDLKGLRVRLITGTEFASACASFIDLLRDRALWHQEQDELDTAVGSARLRPVGTAGEMAWKLQGASGIGPLAAVTRAVAALLLAPSSPPSSPVGLPSEQLAEDGLTDSIAEQVF